MTPERWQQIKAVLGDALEKPLVERAKFLDQICANDPSLRAEVESLIDVEQSGDNRIDSLAGYFQGEQASLLATVGQSATATLGAGNYTSEINRRIGPYKIVREVGRGGMGAVYLAARADDQYRRQVAIKLIPRGMDTDSVLRRFRNERQILAALDHQNIAKLLDGGTTDDGLPYLVMEFVPGVPIDDYCDHHRLGTDQRLRLFQQVCAAVHYAHQRQVIHRDIKATNILVTEEGGLKLLDFGIAKLLTPELAAQTLDPTLTALRPMTPAYASPEQIKGELVTTRTDVYSLGVLLYELLTGRRPYRVASRAPHEVARAILEEEPVKPSSTITLSTSVHTGDGSSGPTLVTPESVSKTREGSPERLRRRLRGDLDNIVLTALRKDPQRRYASVEQFSEDIQRHLDGLPVIARKDTVTYRTVKFVRRNRVGVTVFALSVLLLPIAFFASIWTSRISTAIPEGKIRSIAVLPFKTVDAEPGEEYIGFGIADEIVSSLTHLTQLTVRPIRTSQNYSGANQESVEAGEALRVDAILEGSIRRIEGGFAATAQLVRVADGSRLWQMERGEFESPMMAQGVIAELAAQALDLELTAQDRSFLTRRHTDDVAGSQLYLRGRYLCSQRAWKDVRQGIDCYEQAIKIAPEFAQPRAGLALVSIRLNNRLPHMERMQRAKQEATKALELDETLAEAHTALGRALTFCDWDWAGADQEYRRAIELKPKYAESHYWYSDNLSATGRHQEAISELRLALETDPLAPRIHLRLGWALYFARQYDQAIEQFRKTPMEVDESNYQVYWRLGLVYLQKSRYEEAISMLKKAATLSQELPLTRASLAYAYAKSGNQREARRVLSSLNPTATQIPFINLAAAYASLGENDKAFEWLEVGYRNRDNRVIHIGIEPMLDSLRGDPRFADIMRRVGLIP